MARLPRPLAARGRRSARWRIWQLEQRAAVWRRCRGVCEIPECRQPAAEGHHVFARRHLVAEPLASHEVFVAGLCLDHHREITQHPGTLIEINLMHTAIERGWHLTTVVWISGLLDRSDYVGEARAIEQHMRDTGGWDELLVASGRS